MKNILKKLKQELGAMDKVLVTILLVIVAVAGLIGIEQWSTNQKDNLVDESKQVIETVLDENTNK